MFLVNWFYGILSFLGLYHKKGKILFLGLDNAGKTTLLNMLKSNRLISSHPTQHPNMEELTLGGIKLATFDLGGHESARLLWEQYFTNVDGIVYVVDAADRKRFEESKKELDALLASDNLRTVPFVILGNKIDLPTAVGEDELKACLGLLGATTGKDSTPAKDVRPTEVFMCSIAKRMGYGEGFKWLAKYLQNSTSS